MSNLKPLVWNDSIESSEVEHEFFNYRVIPDHDSIGKFAVRYKDSNSHPATGFATMDDAKAWAWDNYNEKMQPYVVPDSITRTEAWFKAAKPEPTNKDICTQIGCHYEEVSEMDVALDGETGDNEGLAKFYKSCSVGMSDYELEGVDRIELLDSLCDQIVTAVGVGYMMGFDMQGALNEVIRSNDSKMVDGKFIFDANGKIAKPDSYSEPDLTPFISTMQKGEVK